jgi:hypothetical protein
MTYDEVMPEPQHRVEVELPRDLADQVSVIARRRGHVLSALLIGWAERAAVAAKHGRANLPRARSLSKGTDYTRVRWTQSAPEIAEWRRQIRSAGSSLRVVIHAAAIAYVEADGDRLAMPPFWRIAATDGQ